MSKIVTILAWMLVISCMFCEGAKDVKPKNITLGAKTSFQSFQKELKAAKKDLKSILKQIVDAKVELKAFNTDLQLAKAVSLSSSSSASFRCETGIQNSPYLASTAPRYVTVVFDKPFTVTPKITIGTRFAGDWHNALPIVINTWIQGASTKKQFVAGFQTATGSPGAYISISWFACGL